MERLTKITCALLLVAILSFAFSSVVFADETPADTTVDTTVTAQQEELAKKEKALAKKEKTLRAKEKKLSREERKRKQAELKRQQEEIKRQQEELKKKADDAVREKEELERQYAEKDSNLMLYGGIALAVILVIIIVIVVVSAKRRKRSEELEKELIRSETLIESFEAEKNAKKEEATQKQNIGRNSVSFVVMKDGMAVGQMAANFDTALVIGRAPDCGLRLDNEPTVSGHHCEIRSDGAAYYIRDLGSTNGTALNGVSVTSSTKINNGDKILLGTLELIIAGAPQSTPSMTSNIGDATIRQKV